MILHFNAAQNSVAEHYERDFDMIIHFNPRKTNNKILHFRPGGPPRPTFYFYTQAHLFVRFLEVDTPSYVN